MEVYAKGNRVEGFKNFAKLHNQSYKSVRNDYYNTLRSLSLEDFEKCKLTYNRHIIKKHTPFSDMEINDKITKIMSLYNKGYSLRASCLIIANDDKTLALRYQNKIRTMNLQKRESNILKITNFKQEISINNAYDNTKLLYMSKPKTGITDKDINNLFLGLIRLVKRTYENKFSNNLKQQFNLINVELKEKNLKLLDENIILKKKVNQYKQYMERQSILYNKKLKNLEKALQKFNNSMNDKANKL